MRDGKDAFVILSRSKRRLRALFRRDIMERELDEELRLHLERDIDQNLRNGMSPEQARYAALKAFGGLEQAKEECRDARHYRFVRVRSLKEPRGLSQEYQ